MDNVVTNGTASDGTSSSTLQGLSSSVSTQVGNRSPLLCPACGDQVGHRLQNLKRHILSMHLPCWICCPYPNCIWRGSRPEEFERHLAKEKCGPKPSRDQYEIYDTNLVLDMILEAGTSVDIATSYALDFVAERALELGKEEEWKDRWGRQSQGRRF